MTLDYEAPQISTLVPAKSPKSAGEIMCDYGLASIDASYASGDIVGLARLPKACVPVDCTLLSEALDGGSSVSAAVTAAVGIANASTDDLVSSTNLITATTALQAGGVQRANVAPALMQGIKAKNVDRIVALKITNAAGTGSSSASGATAGAVALNFFYRAAEGADEWSSTLT